MRVLIADRFDAEGVARLRDAGHEILDRPGLSPQALAEAMEGVQALVLRSQAKVDAALAERATSLLAVARAGVGYENIDVEACARLGIAVFNTPGASAITTAERTLTMLLALMHQVPAADRSIRAGKWDRRSFLAHEACGKALGVLGYGNVGRVVADRAKAFGMHVLVHDPNVAPEASFNLGMEPVGFEELLVRADVVSCHVSADPKLKHLLGAREFAKMKKGAFFVNAARGFLMDQAALIEALQSGHLAGAALDVFEEEPLPAGSPLRAMENVVLSPHLGASTVEAERRVSLATADQLVRFLAEGKVSNLVSRPKVFRHTLANGNA